MRSQQTTFIPSGWADRPGSKTQYHYCPNLFIPTDNTNLFIPTTITNPNCSTPNSSIPTIRIPGFHTKRLGHFFKKEDPDVQGQEEYRPTSSSSEDPQT